MVYSNVRNVAKIEEKFAQIGQIEPSYRDYFHTT